LLLLLLLFGLMEATKTTTNKSSFLSVLAFCRAEGGPSACGWEKKESGATGGGGERCCTSGGASIEGKKGATPTTNV
jgi:hypothetical protein